MPSQFGGDPSLLISYDLEDNPFWLRRGVFDEIKKLRDDLFLGKGGVKVGGHNRFVFTWAIAKV